MKASLLLVFWFFSTGPALAEDLWLHPPTKGIADPRPAKAWLEGRAWKVDDPLKHEIPLTPALELGPGVWYQSLVDPPTMKSNIHRVTPRKPAAKPIDLDAISVINPQKSDERSSSLTDDPDFDALRVKFDALEAELAAVESEVLRDRLSTLEAEVHAEEAVSGP